jgi:ppGpp synthetase/RelA/SpoT-type nucleotidyltranferase/CheY-like chemotaxis protein
METSQHTILLIDDSYSTAINGYSKIGRDKGFIFKGFDTIESGISYLEKSHNEIDAVVLGLSFTPNNYEGLTALKQIQRFNELLPVIMLIEKQSDTQIVANCLKEGAFHFVSRMNFDSISLFNILAVAITQYQSKSKSERFKALEREFERKTIAYEKMLYTTEMILQNMLNGKLMFNPTFENRVKEFQSFYNKIVKKEKVEGFIADPFKRFSDMAGLRVIFYNKVDLQTAVDLLVSSNDFVDVKKGGNPIADDKSKSQGYRAVHFDIQLNEEKRLHLEEYKMLMNIPCEVQFKTVFAHSWSKVYHALSYKENTEIKLSTEEQQQLDVNFREAASKLQSIEQQITDLCTIFHLSKHPNAN